MNLDATLALLARDPCAPLDLAELALHLAREEYPDLDVDAYLSELDGMAHEARGRCRGCLEERVRGLCRYLFHEMGFRGNDREFYDARNSYLNVVLDRRLGIPITLTLVAMAVGGRAGLTVHGVGLPGHFVAKAVDEGREVLFDPFHGGRPLTEEQCGLLVQKATGIPFEAGPESLQAVPAGRMVLRMLTNLKGIYLKGGDFPRVVRVIGRLRQLCPEDPLQQRDLGAALVRMDEPGRAIGPLQAYLEAVPDATDTEAVRLLLTQARRAQARWN